MIEYLFSPISLLIRSGVVFEWPTTKTISIKWSVSTVFMKGFKLEGSYMLGLIPKLSETGWAVCKVLLKFVEYIFLMSVVAKILLNSMALICPSGLRFGSAPVDSFSACLTRIKVVELSWISTKKVSILVTVSRTMMVSFIITVSLTVTVLTSGSWLQEENEVTEKNFVWNKYIHKKVQ